MTPLLTTLLALAAGYLLGSIPSGYLAGRWIQGVDIRSLGSGSTGATNVLRSGNKKAAVLTLVFDALKGFVPVVLCLAFGERVGLTPVTAAWVGLAAFVGHLWPVFFGFKGGKGVATAAGVLIASAHGDAPTRSVIARRNASAHVSHPATGGSVHITTVAATTQGT